MDIKKYKRFVYSYYLGGGLRITTGVVLPAIILNYFNLLGAGIAASLGALCVSLADNPGPIHHRRNGMAACMGIVFIVALLTGFADPYPWAMGILLFVFCFLFSMIGVYGSRANSIGLAALLVMVLNMEHPYPAHEVWFQSLFILAGGAWYTGLSMLLYSFRPYQLIRQVLGECLLATAAWFRTRASFYDREAHPGDIQQQIRQQQITVHESQELVRELLFRSRNIVKESTPASRALVMIFVESVDLFEKSMASYQDYRELHHAFDKTGILDKFQQLILFMAGELENIGIAVQSGRPSGENETLRAALRDARKNYEALRDQSRTPENIEQYIPLHQILNNLEDIAARIHSLHLYTGYDPELPPDALPAGSYEKFITRQDRDPSLWWENLSLDSNFFRHALRASIATLCGYLISLSLQVGHSYWILLTIIVILKPAYSLTKKRNYERLIGTVGGALAALVILYFVKDRTVLFMLMLLLMIGTYSFLRMNYMISVVLMTPFILLLFFLLDSSSFKVVFLDRVTDTAIGSGIAFLANLLVLPMWEQDRIRDYMAKAMEENRNYFKKATGFLLGKAGSITEYKLSRKQAFVALANLSDAFSRMLSEPKSKQKNSRLVHQFVVSNHLLTAHIATLYQYAQTGPGMDLPGDPAFIAHNILQVMESTVKILRDEPLPPAPAEPADAGQSLEDAVERLMEQRRQELQQGPGITETGKRLSFLKPVADQFHFIGSLASDIRTLASRLEKE